MVDPVAGVRDISPERPVLSTVSAVRPFTAFVLLLLLALIVGTFVWKLQTTGLTL